MIALATRLMWTAAILATLRAIALWLLPWWKGFTGFASPQASNDNLPTVSPHSRWLAVVLWSDCANDAINRFVNEHLPPPGGAPLTGLARAGAHLGLAAYAAWICATLAFVGLLVRHRLPKFGVISAAVLWVTFVVPNVLFYHELRSDNALRGLGALHIVAFLCELRCLLLFAKPGAAKLRTEQVCAVWLVFLGVAAGIGPLRPWEMGTIDRVMAEDIMGAAMATLYALIVITILVRGVTCFGSFWLSSSWRSRGCS